MLILLHVLIASSSLVFTGYLFLHPSVKKLLTAYLWVGMTILSGIVLVIQMPSHMVSACFAGLFYLGIVFCGIIGARLKLIRSVQR